MTTPTVDYVQFASTDNGTNLEAQAAYLADPQLLIGNQPGVARFTMVNKALRQATFMSAALASFVATKLGVNVLDDANLSGFLTNLTNALAATPTGTLIASGSLLPPVGYLACDGSTVSRTTYASLFASLSLVTTGANTNGTAVISSIPSTAGFVYGMPLSGAGIPAGAYVSTVNSSTSITISVNTTAAVTSFTLAPYGVGDGATTFNLPNTIGLFLRGSGGQTINGVVYSATLGQIQLDEFQGHQHQIRMDISGGSTQYGNTYNGGSSDFFQNNTTDAVTDGGNGAVRYGSETRPANIGVNYFIKT